MRKSRRLNYKTIIYEWSKSKAMLGFSCILLTWNECLRYSGNILWQLEQAICQNSLKRKYTPSSHPTLSWYCPSTLPSYAAYSPQPHSIEFSLTWVLSLVHRHRSAATAAQQNLFIYISYLFSNVLINAKNCSASMYDTQGQTNAYADVSY